MLAAVGCAGDGQDQGRAPATTVGLTGIDVGQGSDTDAGDGEASDGSDGGGGSESDGGGSGGLPDFDTDGQDPDGTEDAGCDKVDVLLAVDNSGSMQEEIAALQGPVFDSFPQQLLAVNGGLLDFQLGVIDACNNPAYLHNWGAPGDCNFANGANYMVSTNPALAAEYGCVTQLDQTGFDGISDNCSGDNDDEQPANTAADAVVDTMNMNVGFVRDDAVLLVVAITDEDEKPLPSQSAQEVANKIISAKGGDIDDVVFLGIGGDANCDGPYGSAEEASTLREITQIFEGAGRGLWWDLCGGDLETAFSTVVGVVDTACSEFEPEG